MIECLNCGTENVIGGKFCIGCGNALPDTPDGEDGALPAAAAILPAAAQKSRGRFLFPLLTLFLVAVVAVAGIMLFSNWSGAPQPLVAAALGESPTPVVPRNTSTATPTPTTTPPPTNTPVPATATPTPDPNSSERLIAFVQREGHQEIVSLNPQSGEAHTLAVPTGDDSRYGIPISSSEPVRRRIYITEAQGTSFYSGAKSARGNAFSLPEWQRIVTIYFEDGAWALALSDLDGANKTVLIRDAEVILPIIDPEDGILAVSVARDDSISGQVFSLPNGEYLGTAFRSAWDGNSVLPSIIAPLRYSEGVQSYIFSEGGSFRHILSSYDGRDVVHLRENYTRASWQITTSFVETPDGKFVLYSHPDGIYRRLINGDDPTWLTNHTGSIIDITSDGRHLLLLSDMNRTGTTQLLTIVNVFDGSLVEVISGENGMWGAFTDNDEKVLVFTGTKTSRQDENSDVFLYSLQEGDFVLSLRDQHMSDLIVTDGRYFALTHKHYLEELHDLSLSVIDTQENRLIPVHTGNAGDALTLEEGNLLYSTREESGRKELHFYSIDADENVLLDHLQSDRLDFSSYGGARFVGDGKSVVFHAVTSHGTYAIYRINVDGQGKELLLDNARLQN